MSEGSDEGQSEGAGPEASEEPQEGETEERGRTLEGATSKRPKSNKDAESAIDVLYENQRGGFLCGIPLFSSKALGGLDAAPWTNIAQKPSATDIHNAQPPDPSWKWAWEDWHINHSDEVDDDGWEYSFAFGKKISWHGPTWWNSFVRRRAWTRKRVKKQVGYKANDAHMPNPNYFTINPAEDRSRSRASTMEGSATNRYSISSVARREMGDDIVVEDIHDIDSLMRALRFSRIDREKMEAVENFIEHGGDDLYYLRDHMHEIMRMFIFQASRRLLLTHLLKIFNEASEEQKHISANEKDVAAVKKRRLENLEAAVKHADEEVKKLEFWSDVKDIAENGQTKGALDESQGWDKSWAGLDRSGPKDVTLDKKVAGTDNCEKGKGNGMAISSGSENAKGKAKEQG